MKTILKIISPFILLYAGFVFAQNTTNNAVLVFSQYAPKDARNINLEVVQKGFKSADIFKKIGDSFYFEGDYDKAVTWYDKLLTTYPSETSITAKLRYIQSLRAVDRNTQADALLASLDKSVFTPSSKTRPDNGTSTRKETTTLEDVGLVNSRLDDFAPTLYQGNLVFASAGHTSPNTKGKAKTKSTTDLFLSSYDSNLNYFISPTPLDKNINTKYDEHSATFSKDGKTLYFTRNTNGKSKIYKATKKNGSWGKPSSLSFNSNSYTTAHPTLNSNNTRLYFASNMPGGIGLSDIWYVQINGDGSYGKPVNAGAPINTKGNETYPFISASGKIYFASDTHAGLGGLDLFVTSDGNQNEGTRGIKNLGEPINSSFDDYALSTDEDNVSGFFASNRDKGRGGADIYKFKMEHSCSVLLEGLILEQGYNSPISGVEVTLVDATNTIVETVVTNASGSYLFSTAQCDERYTIRASKNHFTKTDVFFGTHDAAGVVKHNLYLENNLKSLKVGDDLAKVLELNPISFGIDRFNIEGQAALELEKVIAFMNANPNIKIDVRSHTDSRSRDSYNLLLSDKRNTATIAYMIDNGVNKRRLSGKGYGESQPLNRCSNGVRCSEEEHQRNRRSEFIVLRL